MRRIPWFRLRRKIDPGPPTPAVPGPVPPPPANPPAWMTQPTLAYPQPGRVGWLTPAQAWRANHGRRWETQTPRNGQVAGRNQPRTVRD